MVSGAYKTEFGESDEISQCMKKVEVSCYLTWPENRKKLKKQSRADFQEVALSVFYAV